jgi:hypothetical protein
MEDLCRLQAVDGDYLRSVLNLDGVGLIAPVEDHLRADMWLGGLPQGTMP